MSSKFFNEFLIYSKKKGKLSQWIIKISSSSFNSVAVFQIPKKPFPSPLTCGLNKIIPPNWIEIGNSVELLERFLNFKNIHRKKRIGSWDWLVKFGSIKSDGMCGKLFSFFVGGSSFLSPYIRIEILLEYSQLFVSILLLFHGSMPSKSKMNFLSFKNNENN